MATVLEQQDTPPVQAVEPAPASEESKRDTRKKQSIASSAAMAVARKRWGMPGFLRSPWLLLSAALIVGGFWLVNNSWVITENIDKPYALLAGPVLAGSFVACWLIVKFFEAIERGVRSAWAAFLSYRKQDAGAQFFWIVITVFLAVSVFASGDFFSKLERDALPGLGYATALFVDLVDVQCMRARLNAGRLRDRRGQFLYLLGVLICALASAFANVYTSLSTFNDKATGALPSWMPGVAPWFGLVFPVLIVLLSMTADYTVDQTSSKLDPESYKEQESKRVKLLEYQRDLLRSRVGIEREIDDLASQLRGRRERRVFFLWTWLFPLQVSSTRLLEQVEGLYKPQLDALKAQNELLRGELANLSAAAQAAYAGLDQTLQQYMRATDSQRDIDNGLLAARMDDLAVQLSVATASPDYQAIAEKILPLLAPVVNDLRQEVQAMVRAAPKLNYTKLAQALAPLLVESQKEPGLQEVSASSPGSTQENDVLDMEKLMAVDLLAAPHGQDELGAKGDNSVDGEDDSGGKRKDDGLVDREDDKGNRNEGDDSVDTTDDREDFQIVDLADYRIGPLPDDTSARRSASKRRRSAVSTTKDRGAARRKASRLLKKQPGLTPTDLAKKAGISRQYASKLLAELRRVAQ